VNATTLTPGQYVVYVIVIDSNLNTASSLVNVNVVPADVFTILNEDQNFEPASFPYNATIPLLSSGQMGTGAVTWSLIPAITTMPGASIAAASLTFSLTAFGSWTVGVSATDSFGNVVNKVLVFQVLSSAVYQLVDGQVELKVTAPVTKVGVQSFSLSVTDSNNTVATQTFNYTVAPPVSSIDISEYSFDHYWGAGDTTTVALPVFGDLSGFSFGELSLPSLSDGLTVSFDALDAIVEIGGPPALFQNTELAIPIAVMQGGIQVATITREYTLLSHNGTNNLGQFACYTKPYFVGDSVGLNPLKPFFNSPTVSKPAGAVVSIPFGSALPAGLSLDANTGLIYGTIVSTFSGSCTLQYNDSNNTALGTVSIYWDIQQNSFSLLDNLTDGQIQQAYNGSLLINGASSFALASVGVYRGRLPAGLSLTISSNQQAVNLTGVPQEAGQFDLWIQVVNNSGSTSCVYHRLLIEYIPVLSVLTTSLPPLTTGVFYQQVLQGFGGIHPYTWSLNPASPVLPAGLSLTSSGVLSGTPTGSSYNQTILVNLTDSRSPAVVSSQGLPLVMDNSLKISTTALPNIIPGQWYSFQLSATGGTGSYSWSLPVSGFTLPAGITFSSTTGVFTGVFSGVPTPNYSSSVTITVTSGSSTQTKVFTLATGTAELLIDTSGVGLINRGNPYQGILRSFNAVQPPVQWQVTPNSPNVLPAGLSLQANSGDNGVTAIISGTSVVKADGSTGYPQIPITVSAVDSAQNSAQTFLLLTTTSSLAITTPALPIATVGGIYNVTLNATGGAPPYTWDVDPTSPNTLAGSGMTLTSAGVLSGSGVSVMSPNILFRVRDSLTPANADSQMLALKIVSSTLAIATTALLQAEANRTYTMQLVATGGTGSYSWSITGGQLPLGLTLNPASGLISGLTQVVGTTSLTLTISDTVNQISITLPLVVTNGLALLSGIDYIQGGTPTNSLGFVGLNGVVSAINPCPNLSFFVVATGVVSTAPESIVVSLPTGFSYTISKLTGGVAYIQLAGGFNTYPLGSNSITVIVNDAGVVVTNSFSWTVYNDGVLSAAPTNTLPVRTLA
jgi:hypothetical protein